MFQKVISVLLLIGAVRAFPFQFQIKEEFICPANDNCMVTGCLYANPKDCHSFYLCDNWGNAYLKYCPPNMAFNGRIRTCDWYSQVENCAQLTTSKPITTTGIYSTAGVPISSIPTTISNTPMTETNTVTIEYSTQVSTDQTIVWITTETSSLIDTETETQSSTENPIEITSTITPTLNTDIVASTISSQFVCPISDIANTGCKEPIDCLYPNPIDCNSFIQCVPQIDGTGEPIVIACPSGQQWNDKEKICDWPENSTWPDQQQNELY